MSVQRAIANRLCALAVRLAPTQRRSWAAAMRRELIEMNDGAAVSWAAGCVSVCIQERLATMLSFASFVRAGVAGACLLFACTIALPVVLVVSYRFGWIQGVESLQGGLPGDDYQRFLPLIESITNWQLAAGFVMIATLAIAATLVALNKRIGILGIAGVAALLTLQTVVRHNDAAVQAVFTARELRTDYLQVIVLVVLGAAAFWATRRHQPSSTPPSNQSHKR